MGVSQGNHSLPSMDVLQSAEFTLIWDRFSAVNTWTELQSGLHLEACVTLNEFKATVKSLQSASSVTVC